MSPKPKAVPPRLGPPPQLDQLKAQIAARDRQFAEQMRRRQREARRKLQPKAQELLSRRIKLLARWASENVTLRRVLMSWMVLLVASKMVLLVLTYQFFTLTALISLQVREASVVIT